MAVNHTIRVDWGKSGQSLYYTVKDTQDNVLIARTNNDIIESPSGSGLYQALRVDWDKDWEGTIIWDDGSGLPGHFAEEAFKPLVITIEGEIQLSDSQNFNNIGQITSLPVELVDNRAGTGARVIEVQVKNQDGQALSGVMVRFIEGPHEYYVRTANDGLARFALDDGHYTLAASKTGYNYAPRPYEVTDTDTFAIYMDILEGTRPTLPRPGWFGDDGNIVDVGLIQEDEPNPMPVVPTPPMSLPRPRPPSKQWF